MFKHPIELFSNIIFWFDELSVIFTFNEIFFKNIQPSTNIEEESNINSESEIVKLFKIEKLIEEKFTELWINLYIILNSNVC